MMTLEGTVEYVIHRNPQNGYSVIEISDEKGLVTLVGNLPELHEGELIRVEGSFIIHPTYGEQFQVERFTPAIPVGARSIENYLASGVIKGIGPMLAGRIVSLFGENSLRIMEEEPEKLAAVPGISLKGARKISVQVIEKRQQRDALLYMDSLGIPLSLATRIYERYGNSLYQVIEENPYRLMDDLTHVGFRIADEIARRSGLSEESSFRIRSGLRYAMGQALESGHIYLPLEKLLPYASELLSLPPELIEKEIEELHFDRHFMLREIEGEPVVYLASYYYMELGAASRLRTLSEIPSSSPEQASLDLARLEKDLSLSLEEKQREAVLTAVTKGVSVITGGPGTGKTTIISAVLAYYEALGCRVELAAPTGRAAKRITEATGRPAKTIHRLLEFMGSVEDELKEDASLRFTRNENNPLEADAVILDEVSMVDLPLFYALLKAISPRTRLILVGDADQLPSVGPGNVLKDIIRSSVIPVIFLSKIFRQDQESDIVSNAHRINQGERIDLSIPSRDFLFVKRFQADQILDAVIRLVKEKLPEYLGISSDDIQVIAPMRKGQLGIENLNRILQNALNPAEEGKKERLLSGGLFRQGDKVMQIKNNYQKEWESISESAHRFGLGVFNGDIGVIEDIRFFTEELVVLFDDERRCIYHFNESDELDLAYAVTIHKAQGSEYPALVIPLLNVPRPLMTRPLLYTAITRARSCVCLVGSPDTFQQMADNNMEQHRYSSLDLHLRELFSLR